jgi:hypothetical protein
MSGKGSKQRPTDMQKYRDNWDKIFNKEKSEKKNDKPASKEKK